MKDIAKVITITDSNNSSTGYYKVVFIDGSFQQASPEMNIETYKEVKKWLRNNKVEYDTENISIKIKQHITNKIERLYIKAQIVKVVNGIIFYYPVAGDGYSKFTNKVQEARHLNLCSIIIEGVDNVSYLASPPYNLMMKIYQAMDIVASVNNSIKTRLEQTLETHFNNRDIGAMKNLNLDIFETNSEINLNKICDDILKEYPDDKYLNRIKFSSNGESRYHIFTELKDIS